MAEESGQAIGISAFAVCLAKSQEEIFKSLGKCSIEIRGQKKLDQSAF